MKLSLIGHGAMRKLIETLAKNKNHEVAVIFDETHASLLPENLAEKLKALMRRLIFRLPKPLEEMSKRV